MIKFHGSQAEEIDAFLQRGVLKIHLGNDDGVQLPVDGDLAGRLRCRCLFSCCRRCGFLGFRRAEGDKQRNDANATRTSGESWLAVYRDFPDPGLHARAELKNPDKAEAETMGG